jgi:hypothetical protein
MDEDEDVMEAQTVEVTQSRLICGRVECIRDGIIVSMEIRPDLPADPPMYQ